MAENGVLVQLFRHNLWANDQMVAACRPLTDAELNTESAGTYGRVSQILVHLARAQGGYLRTLSGWEPLPEHALEYGDPFVGVDRIAEHLRFTGERLVQVAREASVDRIVEGHRNGQPFRYPEWVVLLQAAQHATEHRQQIATSLSVLGVAPPEPDVWAYWDAIRSGG